MFGRFSTKRQENRCSVVEWMLSLVVVSPLSGHINSVSSTVLFNWMHTPLVSEKLTSAWSQDDAYLGWIACFLSGAPTLCLSVYILSSVFTLSVSCKTITFKITNSVSSFTQHNLLFWLETSLDLPNKCLWLKVTKKKTYNSSLCYHFYIPLTN